MMKDVHVELNPDCHGKSSIQHEEEPFHQQTVRRFKEETSKVLCLEHSFIQCGNLGTSENRSEIT
jgi:hypothetical protein